MSRQMLIALLLTVGLMLLPGEARAEIILEGTVALPDKKPVPPRRGRYAIGAQPGPADPLVAVIYLEGPGIGASTPKNGAKPEQMAQHHLQFVPGVLPVQTGTVVEFPNMDDEYHNVFSYSKAHRFDFGRYRKEEAPPKLTFAEPGVVKLYCEVHDHMRGWILVVDTPYFVKSDPAGRFKLSIPALKDGEYTLKAWIPEGPTLSRQVTLKDGATVTVTFEET